MSDEYSEGENRAGSVAEKSGGPQLGDLVGNYLIERRLGAGGQAEVFLARDLVLQRQIALKVFFRGSSPLQTDTGLAEARLVATLDHPNIVRVLHVEQSGGVWYLAMEYVSGGSLDARVCRLGPLRPVVALRCVLSVAVALAHAHGLGVVHRDVKPQNILQSRSGALKLADFGLAAAVVAPRDTVAPAPLGTPQFMSPEVWLGHPATAASDIYGLGATLYFILTGQPPFRAKTIETLRAAHLSQEPVFGADVPAAAANLVRHCMAKEPTARPLPAAALVDEILDVLSTLTGDRRWLVRRRGAVPVAGAEKAEDRRAAARVAVLQLPPLAAARKTLVEALEGTVAVVVVYGCQDETLTRLVHQEVDSQGSRTFLAARLVLAGPEALRGRLSEQLGLQPSAPGTWHGRAVAELVPNGGGSAAKNVVEVALHRTLGASEVTDLVELGVRAEGKGVLFLVVGSAEVAEKLRSEAEALQHAAVVRGIEVPELTPDDRVRYLTLWVETASAGRAHWTPDGLRMAAALAADPRGSIERLAHNAIRIAEATGTGLLTTWTVLGAEAHGRYLQTNEEILPEWRTRPARWPDDVMLATLVRLRDEDLSK